MSTANEFFRGTKNGMSLLTLFDHQSSC